METPLVSIIIPTYNRAHLICETLNSVIAQTYLNWECIIIDDGSVDETKKVVESYLVRDSRFQFFERPNERLKGGNGARNFGFEKSKGDYVQWFDSDDLMHVDLLSKKVEKLQSNPISDYCLSRMTAFTKPNNIFTKIKDTNIKTSNLLEDYLSKLIAIGTPTVLWRRAILDNKLFDENLKQSQDLEFNSRMFFKYPNFCLINESLIYYRTDQNSISNRFFEYLEEYLDSFLEVRKRIIAFDKFNKKIAIIEIKEVLGILRYCLASKKYEHGEKIIIFLQTNCNFIDLRIKLESIFIFYKLFKIIGRGDTKLKFLLKL